MPALETRPHSHNPTEPMYPIETRGVTFREVLAEKVNDETLFLYDLLNKHTDQPTDLLKEILDRMGRDTVYLPAVSTLERAEVWMRFRGGENMVELAEDMEEITDPMKVRQLAHRPLDEL